MQETVGEKASVRYLWFLMKWTGGRDSVRTNQAMKACADEVDAQNKTRAGSASFVTGVAGLLVLRNTVDTTVTSDSTVTNALNIALNGSASPQAAELHGELAADWKHAVDKLFTVKGTAVSLSQTVYPLWVQFE
jgi:hypothetical protein